MLDFYQQRLERMLNDGEISLQDYQHEMLRYEKYLSDDDADFRRRERETLEEY